jgi:hypothetical protein
MRSALLCLLLSALSVVASASAIEVAYTVTGSPGDWNVNFSVTNRMTAWPAQDIYHFGVRLSGSNFVGSPGNFSPYSAFWSNASYGGSAVFYNNTWYDFTYGDLTAGNTMSGFVVGIPDIAPPLQVEWFAFSANTTFDPADAYTGSEAFYNDGDSAGFEGIASQSAPGVPEPATVALLAGSLGILSLVRHRRAVR